MNQFGISGDMTGKPSFLELTQNPCSRSQSETGIVGENFVDQPTQSAHHLLGGNQEKALFLQELEFLHRKLQEQQTLVESLTEELLSSQEQIAQMERDLALLQQRYDEQRHLHKNAEDNCQNLRTRLCRQQHQTLQFKTALEKCLDSTLDQSELGFDRTYSTTESAQPLLQPLTRHQPLPKTDLISLRTLELPDTASNQAGVNIDASRLSLDAKHPVDPCQANMTLKVPEEASLEIDCSDAIAFPARSTHVSSFQGQPVQPWSAPQSFHTGDSEQQRQEQSIGSTDAQCNNAASPIQAEAAKPSKPSDRLAASTNSTRSSPLFEPLQPPSRRKLVARVELPPLPRCGR